MSCKITELLNKVENIKTEISDSSYLTIVNSISEIKHQENQFKKQLSRVKRKAYKLHWQLSAITEYGVAQEYDSDSSDLVFIETFT